MQLLAGCRHAIILDAVQQAAGSISEYTAEDVRLSPHLHSTHGIGVGEALALAEKLLQPTVPVTLIGVGTGPCEDGGSSAQFSGVLAPLEQRLLETIARAGAAPDKFSSPAKELP